MSERIKINLNQICLDISNIEDPRLVVPGLPDVRPISNVNKTTTEIIIARESEVSVDKQDTKKPKEWVKPNIAFINNDNLIVVRETARFKDSDEDLIDKLVVFKGWTPISIEPAEERKRNYSVRLNIGVIAWKSQVIDNYTVPDGYDSYQILGVYNPYKGTGKVSTDKCMRRYATVQKSGCNHPENISIGAYFFANPDDEIVVKKSSIGKTSYWTKKK